MAEQPVYPTYGGYLESTRPPKVQQSSNGTGNRRAPKAAKQKTFPHSHDGDLDTYDLQDPTYDPDAWYCSVKGASKQARQIWVKFPDHIVEAVERLIYRRCFDEVHTPQDFVRSAVVHELYRRIGEIRDPEFIKANSAHTDLAELNVIRANHEAQRNFVTGAAEELAEAEGSPKMTREILDRIWAAMDSGEYDGRLYEELERLSQAYGHKWRPRLVELPPDDFVPHVGNGNGNRNGNGRH